MIAIKWEVLRCLIDKYRRELTSCGSVKEFTSRLAELAEVEGYSVVEKK